MVKNGEHNFHSGCVRCGAHSALIFISPAILLALSTASGTHMDATYRDSEAREPNWPVRSPDTLFDSSLGVSSVAKKIVKGLVFFTGSSQLNFIFNHELVYWHKFLGFQTKPNH